MTQNEKIVINKKFKEFVNSKQAYYRRVLNKTLIHLNKCERLNIITPRDCDKCITEMNTIINYLDEYENKEIINENDYSNTYIDTLQKCNDMLNDIFNKYGTKDLIDIVNISFGNNFLETYPAFNNNNMNISLFNLLCEYSTPIKVDNLNEEYEDTNNIYNSLDCKPHLTTQTELMANSGDDNLYIKTFVVKLILYFPSINKKTIIHCLTNNIVPSFINNDFIKNKIKLLKENKPDNNSFNTFIFNNYINSLSLSDLCVKSCDSLYNKFMGIINNCKIIKNSTLSNTIVDFNKSSIYNKRNTLYNLLLFVKTHDENQENMYEDEKNSKEYSNIAYILYDILISSTNNYSYSDIIYSSFPWSIKKLVKHCMLTGVRALNDYTNFKIDDVPLEQQIMMMNVNDNVKQKAMSKLNEVKSKSPETGSKAQHYIENLLKIPFGKYRIEPMLTLTKKMESQFRIFLNSYDLYEELNIEEKEKYTLIDIQNSINKIKNSMYDKNKEFNEKINLKLDKLKRDELIKIVLKTNKFITQTKINKKYNLSIKKILHSGQKKEYLKNNIKEFYNTICNIKELSNKYLTNIFPTMNFELINIEKDSEKINSCWNTVKLNIQNIKNTMDNAIYGHTNAKRQIERVIGQWVTGEQKGYCFGFEGPPGVGKTSIAKEGIAKCLRDINGKSRPFEFIAIGGSSNSSTLVGHNYTYVGSSWGQIVDILIKCKCMNPIIFIDELDKISNTENGKEIIGILTHLVDSTQNSQFNDKYFSGIDIDLSKVLFIFSYNDPNLIDRILLDRIHRVNFDSLTIKEKITIVKNYLIPEISKKVNLNNSISIDDDTIRFLIKTYTNEPGVRKLKELLFEIFTEINLEILNLETEHFEYDDENKLILNETIIKERYTKDRIEIKPNKISNKNSIGLINGLWANSLGQGGITLIQASFYPSKTFFQLKLTGMQGDVMKESMNVASSLAYNLTTTNNTKTEMNKLIKNIENSNCKGIHIHCPEGSVPKDGPSAGTAITIVIYSILNEKKIRNDIAITGEITLKGDVTMIGGLQHKIDGGIKAGIKEFIFPKDNHDDFIKYKNSEKKDCDITGIKFHEVSHINEVLELVFE
mgnify:CR=1 FL=1